MALSNLRDWANLADGPVGLLAERVLANDVADYIRFRAVCQPWRWCCIDPHGHDDWRFYPRHWIMLWEKLSPSHRRRFLNVSTGECIKVDLSELCNHDTLALTPEGLLVLLHKGTHVRLLNPLTRHLMELPPITTLLPREFLWNVGNPHFVKHVKAWGSGVTNDSMVVLCLHKLRILGIAKPGDESWTRIQYECLQPTATVFLGRFYCVTKNNLLVLETSVGQPPRMVVAAKLCAPFCQTFHSMHLVGSGGELMLVHRMQSNPMRYDYSVYRLDLETGKLIQAKSFNGRALFIGMYCSFSVSTEVFPSITSDAIYFSLDMVERSPLQIEAYHLSSGYEELASYILDRSLSSLPSPHTLVDCLSLCNTFRESFRHLGATF